MANQVDYPIVGGYNNQRISNIDSERSVNLWPYIDPLGKKPKSLLPTSGLLDSEIDFPGATGGFRAEFVFNNGQFIVDGKNISSHFVVIGNNVYRIDPDDNAVLISSPSLTTTTGYVGIDANSATNPQVIFVDGVKGYIYDTVAETWTEITDTKFPAKPIDVCYLDGWFVVANGDTNAFQLSELNQGLLWSDGTTTFTTNSVTDELTIIGGTDNYQTGIAIEFIAGGGLPAPLVAAKTYYAIRIDGSKIKVAESFADAIAGTPIDITTNGTDPNTITNNGQLQLGSITSHPGTIVACRTLHRRLFLFSQNFTEVWENAGLGTNLPFRRNNSLLMEVGTPAIGSISVGFDRMFFLSQDKDGLGSVMGVTGAQSYPVSTRALDFQLAQYASNSAYLVPGQSTGVTDARGIMVKENGIIFYRLNFTTANHTFVYNVTLSDPSSDEGKLWHEEEVLNGDRHPAQTHGYFNGKNYYGSYDSTVLYIVDDSYNTNNGEPIRRMRIAAPMCPPGYQRTRIDRFQLDLRQGDIAMIQQTQVPLNILAEDSLELLTEGDDNLIIEGLLTLETTIDQPPVFLSISKDGGVSYGYRQVALMGALGQRTYRTVWRKLGTIPRGQAFVPKIEFFAEIPFVILGAAWVYEVMPE